jgi:hypothetical protein
MTRRDAGKGHKQGNLMKNMHKTLGFGILMLAIATFSGQKAFAADVTVAWDVPTQNTDGSALTDLAGYKLSWGRALGSYDVTVDAGNSTTRVLTGLSEGATYYAAAKAYNSAGRESSYCTELTFTVADVTAPVITPPAASTLEANAEGKIAVPDFASSLSVTDNVSPRAQIVVSQAPAAGSLVGVGTTAVTLRAADAAGNTAQVAVNLTVNALNLAPVISAGPDVTVTGLTSVVTLAGTASDDGQPSGSTMTVAWSQISGPGVAAFANATSARTTVTFSQAGTYVLRLKGTDGTLDSVDDVQVIIKPILIPGPPRNLRVVTK